MFEIIAHCIICDAEGGFSGIGGRFVLSVCFYLTFFNLPRPATAATAATTTTTATA